MTIPKIIRHRKKVHITLDIAEELVNDIDQSWAFKNKAIKNDEKDVQKLSRFYNGEKSSHFFGGEQAAKPLSPYFCLLYPY